MFMNGTDSVLQDFYTNSSSLPTATCNSQPFSHKHSPTGWVAVKTTGFSVLRDGQGGLTVASAPWGPQDDGPRKKKSMQALSQA